jgi:hypothetical protein
MTEQVEGDRDITTGIFLGIYANPVDNIEKLSSSKNG